MSHARSGTASAASSPERDAPARAGANPTENSVGAATLWLLRHPLAVSAVLVAGAVLLWLGSQWPQVQAPLLATDGLAREDHLTLQALGLHRWAGSLPVLVWTIAAVAVAAARLLLPPAHGSVPASPPRSLSMAASSAWLLALICWVGWGSWVGLAPQPELVDIAVDVPQIPAQAWTADGGRLAPAVGRWTGKCQRQGLDLSCQIQGPQGQWSAVLAPGRSENRGDTQLTWVGRAPAVASPAFGVLVPQVAGAPSLVRLQDGQAVDTPALHARWLPAVAAVAGPVIVEIGEKNSRIWTSPALLARPQGAAQASAQVQTGELARIAVAPNSLRAQLWAWALVAMAIAALLTWPDRWRTGAAAKEAS